MNEPKDIKLMAQALLQKATQLTIKYNLQVWTADLKRAHLYHLTQECLSDFELEPYLRDLNSSGAYNKYDA